MTRFLALAAAFVAIGCGGQVATTDQPPPADAVDAGTSVEPTDGGSGQPPACVSTRTFFRRDVWEPVLKTSCFKCHAADGVAVVRDRAKFVLQPAAYPGFLDENLRNVTEVSKITYEGISELLQKPLGRMGHGGGPVLTEDSEGYRLLSELVARLEKPDSCTETEAGLSLDGVTLLDARQTYRKAALHLVGRLPTSAEEALLVAGGEPALPAALDTLLAEPEFLVRAAEGWNDLLLTDKYQWAGRTYPVAINLLNGDDYPGAKALRAEWDADRWAGYDEAGKRALNDAVGREPLRLIAHVIANDRPFSEVLTAPYVVADDALAKAYAINDGQTGVREATVTYPNGTAVPHAGILSTPAMLNRWPTTATNRSRARARFVLKHFLATDILKIADRPIDVALVTQQDNPTMNADQCTVCHRTMDPISGGWRGYDASDYERFKADRPWYDDMFHPGYASEDMPSASYGAALPWLAQQVVSDPRFNRAIVQQAFTFVTGRPPLDYPQPGANLEARLAAWQVQDAYFVQLSTEFAQQNRNYRKLVKAIVLGPYYRAANAPGADESRLAALAAHGTARLLTPEMLNRKLIALTGIHWRKMWDWANEQDWLKEPGTAALYGGIDSDTTTERLAAPNGVSSNLAWRIATENACMAVPFDFSKPPEERLLFPLASMEEIPESAGHEVPGAIADIKGNIAHLMRRFWGDEPPQAEVDAAYQLFLETWREGYTTPDLRASSLNWPCTVSTIDGTNLPQPIRRDAEYTVRSWMAVVAYLLADYRVLYE